MDIAPVPLYAYRAYRVPSLYPGVTWQYQGCQVTWTRAFVDFYSAAHEFLQFLGVTSALHRDLGGN